VDLDKIVYENGNVPLFDACRSGNKELVEYLVEHGADICKSGCNDETPLFDACYSGNKELVKYLVRTWSRYK